jgi:hypothetical protein
MIMSRVVIGSLLTALAIAGCGGGKSSSSTGAGSSSSSSSNSSSSKATAAYRQQVLPIAAEFRSSVPKSKFKLQTAITPASRAAALGELGAEFRRLANRLEVLHPPTGAEAEQKAAVAAAQKGADDFKRAEGPARANDKKALKGIGAAMTRDGTEFQQKFSALAKKIDG